MNADDLLDLFEVTDDAVQAPATLEWLGYGGWPALVVLVVNINRTYLLLAKAFLWSR